MSSARSTIFAAAIAATLAACSAGTDKAGGGGLGKPDASTGADTDVPVVDDDSGIVLEDTAVAVDTRLDPDAACASTHFDGERIPPNILLIFDRSGSMDTIDSGSSVSRWDAATAAVSQLLASAPKDLRVGIKFFGTLSDSCSDADYAKPDVAINALSTTQKTINCWLGKASCTGITAAEPYTLTEMGPALRGGISYLKSLSATGQRIAILITDGDPTSCSSGNTITDVIAAAKAGYTGSPKVTTYAIGVPGSTVANLSQVAYAGGGKRIASCIANTSTVSQACHYQIGVASMQADLLKALNDITGKSLTCVFKLPTSTGDAGVDLGAVNVDLTTSGGTSELGRDTSHTNGWDYTDGDTTITLYGPPCDAVMTDGTAKVDILLGCPTKTPQ